jgi:hypothetical protein
MPGSDWDCTSARLKFARQWRNGAVSLHEVAHLAADNTLDVPGANVGLADERAIHIELYCGLTAGDHIALKLGGMSSEKL